MRQTRLSLMLFNALLLCAQPGWAADLDAGGSPLSILFGADKGAKVASFEKLLHTTFHSVNEAVYKTKDNEHEVFQKRYETNIQLLGSSYILNFKFVYDPTAEASSWASFLGPIEKNGGVFKNFQQLLERKFLDDLLSGVAKKEMLEQAKKRMRVEDSDEEEEQDLFSLLPVKKRKLDEQQGAEVTKVALDEKGAKQVLDDYYMLKLRFGFTEFKKVFSVALNPQTVFKNKRSFLDKKCALYKRGNPLEFSISSLSFPDSSAFNQYVAEHAMPMDQMTNVISDNASLAEVFQTIEEAIREELERYCQYVEQTQLNLHAFSSMHS